MLEQILTVAGNTCKESVRQPIHLVLLLVVSALLALAPVFSAFTLGDDDKLLVDVGLSSIFFGGLLLAAFTASRVLSVEIERKTVLTVVSKPIARAVFLTGKFLGVVAAVGVAQWIWSLVFLLAVRHRVMIRARDVYDQPVLIFGLGTAAVALAIALHRNYRHGRAFSSQFTSWLAGLLPLGCLLAFAFDKRWSPQPPWAELDGSVMAALALLAQAMALLCAVAVAASTRLRQNSTLLVCILVFLAGLVSESLIGPRVELSWLARAFYAVIPNLQSLWVADALTQGTVVPAGYVLHTLATTLASTLGILAVALFLFETREVG